MTGYFKVFVYLSAGVIFVRLTDFPMPGPLVGLALMLIEFAVKRRADPEVERIFDSVSQHLAILFVPAGAGVIAHTGMLSSGRWVIVIAVVSGTIATMIVTALCFHHLVAEQPDAHQDCQETNSGS